MLAVAEERDLVTRNPVRVKTRNRELKTPRRRPIYLDSAEQIAALLEAAADLDGRSTARTTGRRGLLATLVFGGLRVHEAAALLWSDVDLPGAKITVGRSKTEAGERVVDVLPVLQDELTEHRATASRLPREDFVFPTASGLVATRTTCVRGSSTRWSPGPTSCSPSTQGTLPRTTKGPQMRTFRTMGAAGFEPATSRV